jgi:long-chain acyl-CoA synthetase
MKNIPQQFFETAERLCNKNALLFKKNKAYSYISYKELSLLVKKCSLALIKLGAQKGSKIAILSENRPEWAISDLAIMSLGGVVVPLHTTFSPHAVLGVLDHSKVKIAIVSGQELLDKIFSNPISFLEKIIVLNDIDREKYKNFKVEILKWDELLAKENPQDFKLQEMNPNEACTIIYTSGTTGIPKGVMLSHNNFLSNVEAVNKAVPIKEKDIFLSFLPLSHVLERMAGYYTPLLLGAQIAYAEGAKQLPANLKEVRPTILISVPRIFEKTYDAIWYKTKSFSPIKRKIFLWALKQKRHSFFGKIADRLVFEKIREQLGGRIRLSISGGASLNEKIAKFFLKIGIAVLEGYGLTETSPVVCVNRENNFRFGTVGKALDGVQVEISPEKEILIKGPNVMLGYLDNEEETKNAIDSNGWFHTGDLGFIDHADGFLTIIGRKKEMIVTCGGKNVWPEEIENQINHMELVSQSMVIGNNRKFVSALIVPDWEKASQLQKSGEIDIFFKEKIEKLNQELSDHEKIRSFRLLPHEFSQEQEELTPTLKLRRHMIEKHYEKEISEMYFI